MKKIRNFPERNRPLLNSEIQWVLQERIEDDPLGQIKNDLLEKFLAATKRSVLSHLTIYKYS